MNLSSISQDESERQVAHNETQSQVAQDAKSMFEINEKSGSPEVSENVSQDEEQANHEQLF